MKPINHSGDGGALSSGRGSFTGSVESLNIPAPIPAVVTNGVIKPNFINNFFSAVTCKISYKYQKNGNTKKDAIFKKAVTGERKYKWSNHIIPPKILSARNKVYDK